MGRALAYRRVLVKLSGEAFGSPKKSIDPLKLAGAARELASLRKLGCQVAVVVGGGNLWRKREQGKGMDAETADYLGLLATVMNALALKQALAKAGVRARVQAAVAADVPLAEPSSIPGARSAVARGEVVIFGGGTGKINFTTDTAAAQRAADVHAELIIKVGPADGVYTADPDKVRSAKKFSTITVTEALRRNLGFMDRAALVLCRKHKVSVVVCKWKKGVLARVVRGERVGSKVVA